MGLGGLREGLERERGCSAIEPAARCVRLPSRLLARVRQRRAMLSSGPRVGAAPTSPRCWSSGNNLKQVCHPTPAPSSPPHSPSSRHSPHARLSHTLSRASQFAMIALLGAREHLAHSLAQPELLYNTICGWMRRTARVRPSNCVWREIGSCVHVVARVHRRHRFYACGAGNAHVHDCLKCCRCSIVVYQMG